MKIAHAAALAWLTLLSSLSAQTGADIPKSAVDRDVTGLLLAPEVWSGAAPLPGQWADVSVKAELQSKELRSLGRIFDRMPQQVQAWYEGGKLVRMEIIFLEAGNVFGFKKSSEAEYEKKEGGAREENKREKELKELKKEEEKEFGEKRKEFAARFEDLEKTVPPAMEAFTKTPGRKVSIGRNDLLRTRAFETSNDTVAMRFAAEEGQLISLTVIPKDSATRKLVGQTTGRRGTIQDNVKTLPNGDVIIENIPMSNQGSRGYCAIGTLAMITQYYGLTLNIDQLAAKAGYKEGDTDNAIVIPIYQAAAKETKLRMKQKDKFDFRDAMREVARGKPLLVWRWFDRDRDEFHFEFAKKLASDPSALLPDPKKDKEEPKKWANSTTGGHASLVTGFNKERAEVLFTESWGEETRNRRMRAEEMTAAVYVLFEFEP